MSKSIKQYDYKKDNNTYLLVNTKLTYSAWASWPREFFVPILGFIFTSIGVAITDFTDLLRPFIAFMWSSCRF